jgi:Raf kinase inhibitor-like YbhB/YbcL family protein
MKITFTAALVVLLAAAGDQQTAKTRDVSVLAIQQIEAPDAKSIQMSSPDLKPNAPIPGTHSDYGEKVSPALRWTGVPASAKSLVLLMEDPDAPAAKPFVHWVVYNLPTTVKELPEGLPSPPRLKELGGALQGRTSKGNIGYFGPRPAKADPPHHYHFQLFALDATLPLDPGASREQVLEAMKGHVVAAGQLVGTFKAPAKAH